MTAERLSEVVVIFDQTMSKKVENASLSSDMPERKCYSIDKILDEHTLYYILYPFGFSPSLIQDFFSQFSRLQSGSVFKSTTHELLIDRGKMIVQPVLDNSLHIKLPIEGKYIVDEKWALRISVVDNDKNFSFKRERNCACLDASTVSFPLFLRNYRQGDRFHPFGMKGSRLVSDFLTDLKVNLFDKRQQWILADSQGKIVWVVGRRIDHRCRVTDSTRQVAVVELVPHETKSSS